MRLQSDSSRERTLEKKRERKSVSERKRERDGQRETERRLKYFRGSRGRAIIEKGFHLASILAGKKCGSEVLSFHWKLICPHRSFVPPEFRFRDAPRARRVYFEGEKEDYPAEKLRVYASLVSTFTANGIMHERTQGGLAERQRARPRARIYGTKIATAARKLSF